MVQVSDNMELGVTELWKMKFNICEHLIFAKWARMPVLLSRSAQECPSCSRAVRKNARLANCAVRNNAHTSAQQYPSFEGIKKNEKMLITAKLTEIKWKFFLGINYEPMACFWNQTRQYSYYSIAAISFCPQVRNNTLPDAT